MASGQLDQARLQLTPLDDDPVPSRPAPALSRPEQLRTRSIALFRQVRSLVTRPVSRRPYVLGELLIMLCLLRVYDVIRSHAEVRRGAAVQHGRDLLQFERDLHIDLEPAVNRWASHHETVALLASCWYQFAHLTVTLVVLVWCYWRRPESYRRARNALVLINAAALAVFLFLPVAPPRLLPGAGFVDSVARAGFGSDHGGPVTADQYGAFPSLHIGWAVWTALVAAILVRRTVVRRLWAVYPFITCAVIVATGNHYLLDAVAGAVLALATFAVTHRTPMPRLCTRTEPRADAVLMATD